MVVGSIEDINNNLTSDRGAVVERLTSDWGMVGWVSNLPAHVLKCSWTRDWAPQCSCYKSTCHLLFNNLQNCSDAQWYNIRYCKHQLQGRGQVVDGVQRLDNLVNEAVCQWSRPVELWTFSVKVVDIKWVCKECTFFPNSLIAHCVTRMWKTFVRGEQGVPMIKLA